MKIIDLLNTPLDKLPKKIKVEDKIYTLYINEANQHYYQDDKCKYFLFSICCFDELNNEVEIIEDKKIEKLSKFTATDNGQEIEIAPTNFEIVKKVNEIIEEVNKLKESK